ncbi:MAG: SMC-Scp complex subunit ScpB [Saprospiraceae bacterium]|nr:SMC-Scp complex subunit ScpB [Saprospiraceae bacterium]
MKQLHQNIESLIFTAEQPISEAEIAHTLEIHFGLSIPKPEIQQAILDLIEKYQSDDFSFELVAIAEGYQFLTKGAFHAIIGTFLKQKTRRRLSRAAMETLSIIAYKQPVTKTEMEKIRGVSCDYSLQKLLEKDLGSNTGRSAGPGRPMLYGTSEKFMDYFGLKSLKELPQPKDFKAPDSSIGEQAPIEELASREEE